MAFTCPYCYADHDLKDCMMKCSYNKARDNTICPDGVIKDADGWINPKYFGKCMKCTKAVKDVYCPDTNKFAKGFAPIIPQRCIVSKSLPLALVGAKATGKSNYICVLVNEIRKRMAMGFGTMINMNCDLASKTAYDERYYRPLYQEKMQIRATDGGEVPPMIFPIDFPKGKMVTLTFYDTAGENLDSAENMQINNGYIPHSKGIIMLLDPLQLPHLRDKLKGSVPLPDQNASAYDVLDRVILILENVLGVPKSGKFDIPLAVVFTKIDALEGFDDLLPEDSNLRVNSEHVEKGAFLMDEFENTQTEMLTILSNILGEDYAEFEQKIERFKTHAVFGVTALGASPDASGRLPAAGVKCRRVLDPFLWLLKENKYIKAIK